MKLWIDDQIDDPETPERWVPEGWTGVKSALQACRMLSRFHVTDVSFDHDLGPPQAGTGYLIARFIESRAARGAIAPVNWEVHSSNPVGRRNIAAAMLSAERFWNNTR